MIRKVLQPRWSVRDECLATFHAKGVNQWNCHISSMFCRKHRGMRVKTRRAFIHRAVKHGVRLPQPWE